jgi:hypothetical protein
VVQDCTAAILNADGRELFIFYSQHMRIWSLVSGICMAVDDSGTTPTVALDSCRGGSKDKWTMSSTGKVMSNHIQNKCIGRSKDMVALKELDI